MTSLSEVGAGDTATQRKNRRASLERIQGCADLAKDVAEVVANALRKSP